LLYSLYAHLVYGLPTYQFDTVLHEKSLFFEKPYSHYVVSKIHTRKFDFDVASKELEKEFKKFGFKQRPVGDFVRLHISKDNAKIEEKLNKSEFRNALSDYQKANYYFKTGQIIYYLKTIIVSRINSTTWFPFIASLLISIVWAFFIRSMDIFRPESWRTIGVTFLISCFFVFVAHAMYDFIDLYFEFNLNGEALHDFMYCFLVIGGTEEFVKLLPWMIILYYKKGFKEPYDYILYASISALGFAFVENLHYLDNYYNTTSRMIMSVTSHMFDASIVAYGFILMKFKYANKKWKSVLPFLGFVLAALSHGFYDFWLLNDSFGDYSIITYVFFFLSLHIWMFFKNNAINHSPFFTRSKRVDKNFLMDFLTVSILVVWMLEYFIISVNYGSLYGNSDIVHRTFIVGLFLIYISFTLQKVELEFGIWKKLSWSKSISNVFEFSMLSQTKEMEDAVGLKLRFFTSKSNKYIGDKLPISGEIIQTFTVDSSNSWYLVQLKTELRFQNFHPKHILIRTKSDYESIYDDKIEILFLLVPHESMLFDIDLKSKDLRYVGAVFSRPIEY
jgi:RsiW-degrading membrane proteinase PrsW (M82 family)